MQTAFTILSKASMDVFPSGKHPRRENRHRKKPSQDPLACNWTVFLFLMGVRSWNYTLLDPSLSRKICSTNRPFGSLLVHSVARNVRPNDYHGSTSYYSLLRCIIYLGVGFSSVMNANCQSHMNVPPLWLCFLSGAFLLHWLQLRMWQSSVCQSGIPDLKAGTIKTELSFFLTGAEIVWYAVLLSGFEVPI